MKIHKFIRAPLCLAILAAGSCFAQSIDDDITGHALTYSRRCRGDVPTHGRAQIEKAVNDFQWCANWSDGVQEALAATGNMPKEISVFDLMVLTLDYIDRHHEKMGMPTIDVMLLAIRSRREAANTGSKKP